jgi:hypothetical protein
VSSSEDKGDLPIALCQGLASFRDASELPSRIESIQIL